MGRYHVNPVTGGQVDDGSSLGFAALQPPQKKCWCLQFRLAGMWGLVLENTDYGHGGRASLLSQKASAALPQRQGCCAGCTLHAAGSTSWFSPDSLIH